MLDVKKLLTKILNAIKTDYIVEQGTSGIWTYRKWNSGIAECWGTYRYEYTSCNTPWGSWYYGTYKNVSFPTSLFVSEPSSVQATRIGGTEGLITMGTWTASQITNMYLIRPAAVDYSSHSLVGLHAIGRWK